MAVAIPGFVAVERVTSMSAGALITLNADIRAVLARFDLPLIEPEKHNASRHGGHQAYYTDVTRKRVGDIFARDIELFGYEF